MHLYTRRLLLFISVLLSVNIASRVPCSWKLNVESFSPWLNCGTGLFLMSRRSQLMNGVAWESVTMLSNACSTALTVACASVQCAVTRLAVGVAGCALLLFYWHNLNHALSNCFLTCGCQARLCLLQSAQLGLKHGRLCTKYLACLSVRSSESSLSQRGLPR